MSYSSTQQRRPASPWQETGRRNRQKGYTAMSQRTLPTIPAWAHWTPHTGTVEMEAQFTGKPLAELPTGQIDYSLWGVEVTDPPATKPLPALEPLQEAWNKALTVAGALGVIGVVWLFLQATRPLGEWLLYLSGSCAL